MSKQTPIQKAIARCEQEIHIAQKTGEGTITGLFVMLTVLKSLLAEEKQFAEDAYKEGCRVASPFGDQGLSKSEKANWPEYYKQYEDGK